MKSKRYLVAVAALPLVGGGTAAALQAGPARPVVANAGDHPVLDPPVVSGQSASGAAPWTRDEALNAYFAAGYTYEQALYLADAWGLDVDEAKARAGRTILGGQEEDVQALLDDAVELDAQADVLFGPGPSDDDLLAYDAFWSAGYTDDQLRILARVWQLDEYDAKAKAGTFILEGDRSLVDDVLADHVAANLGLAAEELRAQLEQVIVDLGPDPTREEVLAYLEGLIADFEQSPLGQELRAQLEQVIVDLGPDPTREEVLAYLEGLIADFEQSPLGQELRAHLESLADEPGPTQEEMLAQRAFWDAGFSYDQLLALAEYWQLESFDAKVKAGFFILDDARFIVDRAIADATPDPHHEPADPSYGSVTSPHTDRDAHRAFWDAGYTQEQLELLSDVWDLTEEAAKAKAGRFILEGDEEPIGVALAYGTAG